MVGTSRSTVKVNFHIDTDVGTVSKTLSVDGNGYN